MSNSFLPPTTVPGVDSASASRILENSDIRLALIKTSFINAPESPNVKQIVISMSVGGKTLNFNRKSSDLVGQVLSRMKISCGKAMKEGSTPPDASPAKKMHKREKQVIAQPEIAFVDSESAAIEEGTLDEVLEKASAIKVDGEEYHIVQDPPVVTSLELETHVWAGFPVVACWTCTGALENEFSFEWRILSAETNETVEIVKDQQSEVFIPEKRHVGNFLQVRCFHPDFPEYHLSSTSTDKIAMYSTSSAEREARLDAPLGKTDEKTLRVATFNILAQPYVRTPLAQDSYYTHLHSKWHLTDWSRRCPLIMREMLDANADIYCLQEVAGGAHETQMKRFLNDTHDWHFFGKESLANNGNPIGVSISLRKSKFTVLAEHRLNIGKDGLFETMLTEAERTEIESKFGDAFFASVLKGIHTVAGVVHARYVDEDRDLLIANTHLFFHPMGGHIRILQGVCLMRKLEEMQREIASVSASKKLPAVIVCGDFNSRPDSGSFQVMSTGSIEANNKDWEFGKAFRSTLVDEDASADIQAPLRAPLAVVEGIEVSHGLRLAHVPRKIPELTHATASFRSTLDYVFFSTDSFEIVHEENCMPELTNAEVDRMGGLPCDHYGSDHVLVCGDLRLK